MSIAVAVWTTAPWLTYATMSDTAGEKETIVFKQASNTSIQKVIGMLNVPVGYVKVAVRVTLYKPMCALVEVLITNF